MKSIFILTFSLLFVCKTVFAQVKIDTTATPEESTFFDGSANTLFAPGFVFRTRAKSYYQIGGKLKQQNKIANPSVKVYKVKRKYFLIVQGLIEPLPATKLQDVIESKIDGDFRGWDGATTFKLLNGDTWIQDEIKTLFNNSIFRPTVIIYRDSDGTFKMKVDGVDETVQVKKK
jgi:hypothetical protein